MSAMGDACDNFILEYRRVIAHLGAVDEGGLRRGFEAGYAAAQTRAEGCTLRVAQASAEWIACGRTWAEFRREPECRPGVLIEVAGRGGIRTLLIGDANELGGGCDHCASIRGGEIVSSYRVVYTEGK